MKKILLLVHAPQTKSGHLNWHAFRDELAPLLDSKAEVQMSALTELTFMLHDDQGAIYDAAQGYDVTDFDLVVFRTIGKQLELATAVAAYCRKQNIPYIDSYIPTVGEAKLSCAFVRWEHGLPVPPTLYAPAANIAEAIKRSGFQYPLVVKDNHGKKGRLNFLGHNASEVEALLSQHSDAKFVVQSLIPNDGDYRILVMNDKPRLAILRRAASEGHLNNTSQGGEAELVALTNVNPGVLELAVRAAQLDRLAVAGVDIMVDKETGRSYILEVNRAPQLATGAFTAEKMQAYAHALEELL